MPQAHRFVIKLHAFGCQVVGADDGGIATGVTAANVALLDDCHIGDAMVARQVIGARKAMAACADDDYIVAGLELRMRCEHPRLGMSVRHSKFE